MTHVYSLLLRGLLALGAAICRPARWGLLLAALLLRTAPARAQSYNLPTPGTIVTCSGTLYATSDRLTRLVPNSNNVRTISPATANSQVTLSFNYFDLRPNVDVSGIRDLVRVYNGPSTASPVLFELTGSASATAAVPLLVTASNATGELTVQLIYAAATAGSDQGFSAGIACVPSLLISAPGDLASCPGGQLTDSGGSQANYQNQESYTRVIAPNVATNRVRLAFSAFDTEASFDYLRIYDGASTSAPLLGTYTGTTGPGVVYATNPTGKLTVQFISDQTVTGAGFVAAVSCVAAPTITSFSPTGGSPNAVVVIQGTNLSGTTAVRFNGVNAPTFTVNSATQVTATVPLGASTGPIVLGTASNGTATSSTAFTVPVPSLSSFSPTSGPAGTLVILTGSNLTGSTAVRFGGVNAPTFTVNSSTQITVTVPASAPAAPISVVTLLGTVTSAASFNVGSQAYLISGAGGISACSGTLYDSGGAAGPYQINENYTRTLTPGTAGSKLQLRFSAFDTYSYTNLPYDPEEIDHLYVYDGPTTGASLLGDFYGNTFSGYRSSLPGPVTATNATGQLTVQFVSGVADFLGISHAGFAADILCVVPPVISSFSPATGGVGTAVVITGTGLTDASDVRFNGTSATAFAVNTPTQVTATVPAGATTGLISLTTPVGSGTSAGTFTVLQPPVIGSFTPATAAGGAGITITGNHFTNTSSVTFNGVNAPTFTVSSATQISVTVPLLATSGRLKVVTPIGTATSATDFTVAAPTISSFSPGNGTAGTVVTVNGTGFSTATAVTFNGVSAAFAVVSAAQVTTTVPITAGTGLIRVATPNGTASSGTSFVVAAPVISGFTPGTGPAGTVVTVNGSGLLATTAVAFNGVAATFAVVSAAQLTATVPNAATTGLISLSAPNGPASSGSSFVVAAPTISGFSPGNGPVGTVVTLNGTGLLATTAVAFNGVAAAFTVVSGTQVTTTVPATATTGAIALSTPAGTATTAAFVVPPPTTISGFSPGTGPAGTVVTVSGSGFGAGTTVAFNGANAPSVTVNSTAQLTVTVPLAATTGPLSVASPSNGPASSSSSFVVPPPAISSFSPTGGPAGTVVTLNGSGLLATTVVRFGGLAAASFTVVSATQITVTVPARALTGPITVEAPSGTGTSAGSFDSGNFLISTASGITACAGQLFDSGGPNGYYQPAEDYVRTISPGDPAKKVQLTVTAFDLYSDGLGNDDLLEIYDGASTSAPLLARYRQRYYALPVGSLTASNAAGQLTVRFRSLNSSAPGFEATIACVVPPVISSFSPGAGPAGTVVVITGTGFSGATAVVFQGTGIITSYTVNSATQITATVPQFAATGPISVTGANAAIAYSAASFDTGQHLISTAGSLTTCSGAIFDPGGPGGDYNPGEGYTRTIYPGTAGSRVRLTFTNFEMENYYGTDYLTIYNGTDTSAPMLGRFTGFALPGTFTATNAAGALTLRFESGVIARSSFQGFAATITCVPGPAISGFTPTSGPVGTVVSLTGTNLTGATAITFAGSGGNVVTVGFVVASATSITGIVVPAGAVTGPLTVTTALGPSLPSTQIFSMPPAVSAVSPAAELPGATVTLTGTSFAAGSSVSFGGVGGTNVSVLSATSLSVTVPAGAAVGSAPVVVTAAGFTSGSAPFTVLGVYSGGTVGACAPAVAATASLNDGQWHYLLSAGQVVAAYRYSGASLGTLALEVLRADPVQAVRKDRNNHYYLDRNFHLTASGGRFDGRAVSLRLYGLNTEFARLQAADPTVTLATLKATQYSGANEDCALANNAANGERRTLAAPAASPAGGAYFVAELTVADHFSEFYLTGSATPLPVELVSFSATAEGRSAVRLNWTTASENNSATFEVERSADGTSFGRIGVVAAAGSSTTPRAYALLDTQVPKTPSPEAPLYYRLRQVDLDGTASYSPVRTVAFTQSLPHSITLFPNPASGAATLTGAPPGTAVAVYDALGRQVASATADAAGTAVLALPRGLASGVYVVRAGATALRLTVE